MSTDIEILWPADRVPITVLLDDPLPGRNPLWYENPAAGHAREIPNAFVERFADVIDRTGAAGKFSVIPCPGATGCLDSGVPDVPNSVIGEFLDIVRTRIAPRWDISPEMLTHNRALDLRRCGRSMSGRTCGRRTRPKRRCIRISRALSGSCATSDWSRTASPHRGRLPRRSKQTISVR